MLRNIIMLMAPKVFSFSFSSGYDLRTQALAAGWDGTTNVLATVPPGVLLAQVTVSGSFPKGVALVISATATIYGHYGVGGDGGWNNDSVQPAKPGFPGQTALTVSVPITITNNGTIWAGSGGGGGGGGSHDAGGTSYNGGKGGNGQDATYAGDNGTAGGSLAGSGGSGGGTSSSGVGYTGTNGTSWNGTSWVTTYGAAGGAAGNAVTGNSNITWLNTGTRIGPIA